MSQAGEQTVTFTIDSRLLEELGENLVTRHHVAVGELIKNAYDADATEVILEFTDAKADDRTDSEIAVIDDGNGMTLTEVRDDFMRIATPNKLREPVSPKYGRERAGNKGIGRFACRRLAHILEIETVGKLSDGDYERTKLEIDWRQYRATQDIDEVTFNATVEDIPAAEVAEDDDPTGTTLRLRDLQDKWTEQDFNTLRRNVVNLAVVEPKDRDAGEEFDPGFDIEFNAPEFERGEGQLYDQIHDASWGCLTGEIDASGKVSLELDAKLIGRRSYSFNHDMQGLAGTEFKISYIPLDNKEHYRDPQTLNISDAREIAGDQSGVRVYMGGFRVFSYGGPKDDWLNIDRERTTHKGRSPDETFDELGSSLELHTDYETVLLSGPQNRNLVGRVTIPTDADLTMAANREEFQGDDELIDGLRNTVRLSLQWMTLQWSHYKEMKSRQEMEEQTQKFLSETEDGDEESEQDDRGADGDQNDDADAQDTDPQRETDSDSEPDETNEEEDEVVDKALDLLEGVAETATETMPEEEQQVSNEAVGTATKVVRNTIDQKEREIEFFRSAFSVNQVVFSFSHELRSMVGNLSSNAGKLEAALDDVPAHRRDEFEEVISDLREMEERFKDQMDLFGLFMETGAQEEAEPQVVQDVVEDILDATEYIADYYNVDISHEGVSESLQTPPMFESELYSIIINLVTNSIKAVGSADNESNRIQIDGETTEDGLRLQVCDTGVGVPEGVRDDVFDPLVSDPANNMYGELTTSMPDELSDQLGRGTGLGLSIVQNIVEKYDGNVRFVDNDGWETCVEVTLNE